MVTASLETQIIKEINEDGSIQLATPNYTLIFNISCQVMLISQCWRERPELFI